MNDNDFTSYGLNETQAENLKKNLHQYLNDKTYRNFKILYNSVPHPTKKEIEQLKITQNPLFYSGVHYPTIDDIIYSQICNFDGVYSESFYRTTLEFLQNISKYEDENDIHTHKSLAYYHWGKYHLKYGNYEDGLLEIHISLKEEYLIHRGQENFPRTNAFKIITLDRSLQDLAIIKIVKFIKKEFLGSYSFDLFYSKFLDKPSTVSLNHMKWLDHVCFFTSKMYKLNRYFKIRSDYFNSTLGELTLASMIGDICLLIESTCKLILGNSLKNDATLFDIYSELCKNIYHWSQNFSNKDFDGSQLENTLKDVLNNNYVPTDSIHNSFLLTYGLRNKILHNINSLNVIRKYFLEIITKQMEFFVDFVINH